MNVDMDWIALHEHPLWESLWSSDMVANKIRGLEAALISGKETDPHALGRQRGELAALRWLCNTVKLNATQQAKVIEEKPVAAVGGIRRFMPRIR